MRSRHNAPALAALLAPTQAGARIEERLLWLCGRVTPSDATLAEIAGLGERLDAAGWARVTALAERNGVENLLFTHVVAAGLGAALPEAVALRLRERYGMVTLLARRLERRLDTLLPLLDAAGVAVIPLKGVRLARRYYAGTVTLRPVTDIDLLVRTEDLAQCGDALEAMGFLPVAGRSEPLSGHALRFRELQFRDASGLMVELHLSLSRHPAYRRALPLAEVWAKAQPTTINGGAALSLALEDELRYLSLHYAAQHQASRLIWLVDVAELLRARGDEIALERWVDETIARGVAAPVAVTLLRAQALLGAPVPAWAAERLKAAALTPGERRAWMATHTQMDHWGRFLAQTLALESAAERIGLLRSGAAALARRMLAR
jgi:hypothetical protein